jgi:hypothetical protein
MSHSHENTLAQLFSHPTSHNIHWRDIVHMFEGLGATCEETKKDHLKVKLNGHEMSFPVPKHAGHTLDNDHEIADIRRFLKACGCAPASDH